HRRATFEWAAEPRQLVSAASIRDGRFNIGSSTPRGLGSFVLLGIEHILTGWDHLLFLLGLLLRGGSWLGLAKIVTAFTLAHSITLALAALNIVVLPDRLVAAVIP